MAGRSPHLLHLTAISNMSLHCICLVLPLTRTLELLQVRCMACITSTVANPMAKKRKKKKKKRDFNCRRRRINSGGIHEGYLGVFSRWVGIQEYRTALTPPGGQPCKSTSERRCCSCQSSAAARPWKKTHARCRVKEVGCGTKSGFRQKLTASVTVASWAK